METVRDQHHGDRQHSPLLTTTHHYPPALPSSEIQVIHTETPGSA